MRLREAEPEKEGTVPQRLDPFLRPRDQAIRDLALDRERRGFDGHVEMRCLEPIVERLLLLAPLRCVNAEVAALEPEIGLLTGEVRMVLAAECGGIALFPEHVEQVLGEVRIWRVMVGPDVSSAGIASCQHADPRRHADGHRGVGTVEPHSLTCEPIHERGGIQDEAFSVRQIRSLLIGHDDDDIGSAWHIHLHAATQN